MFSDFYKPLSLNHVISHKTAITKISDWLHNWSHNYKKKSLFISGLTGIGKTLIIDLILEKYNYNSISIGIDHEINKDYYVNYLKPLLNIKKSLLGKNNIIVLNDVDTIPGISYIIDCIKETKIPIICVSCDRSDKSLKTLINHCEEVKLIKPQFNSVYKFIYEIAKKEKININEETMREIFEQCNGDIRFMINSIQFKNINTIKDNLHSNIFETTSTLLSINESLNDKFIIYWSYPELHTLMIQENYISNIMGKNKMDNQGIIRTLDRLSHSSNALADADICKSNIKMTNWELESYAAMNTINATTNCHKYNMINFTKELGKISSINKKKNDINSEKKERFINTHKWEDISYEIIKYEDIILKTNKMSTIHLTRKEDDVITIIKRKKSRPNKSTKPTKETTETKTLQSHNNITFVNEVNIEDTILSDIVDKEDQNIIQSQIIQNDITIEQPLVIRKRGRPKKNEIIYSNTNSIPVKKGRGRPKTIREIV